MDEGCLSFPNLFLKIKRPRTIKVRFTKPNGDTETMKFDGITARCFLHELDHLNGIVFTSKANRYHLERAMKYKKMIERGKIKEERYV
jgi:peptide deformylase